MFVWTFPYTFMFLFSPPRKFFKMPSAWTPGIDFLLLKLDLQICTAALAPALLGLYFCCVFCPLGLPILDVGIGFFSAFLFIKVKKFFVFLCDVRVFFICIVCDVHHSSRCSSGRRPPCTTCPRSTRRSSQRFAHTTRFLLSTVVRRAEL